ncbi:hypothetical protein B0H17DRAFT_1131450 [Mycena rosella]|uniref:Uncharacterized protein n=1 Tax=Mycena rosella TaxID=1033263 RepID=A0AAD7DPD2_MYCRO|nr:hypothetical protein B0H17DRAFT_1131450 [Mycena rosella]
METLHLPAFLASPALWSALCHVPDPLPHDNSGFITAQPTLRCAAWAGMLGFEGRIMEGVCECLRIGAEDKDTNICTLITQLCPHHVSLYMVPHAAPAETPVNTRAIPVRELIQCDLNAQRMQQTSPRA